MTGCTLKILDPTLKFFLGKGTFDSYEEFRETLLNKVDDKLIPIGKEIRKIDLTVSPPGYSVLVGNNVVVFESLETLVNQMLAGLLETNDPNSQFSSFIQTADIYNAKYNSPEFITKQIKEKDLDFLESTLDFYVSYPVDQEFKNTDLYQEFLERTEMVREVISNLRPVKVEDVLITDESTFQEDKPSRDFYIYSLTNFYATPKNEEVGKTVYDNKSPLAIIQHKVSAKVEKLMKEGRQFYMRMEPDNASNMQTVSIDKIEKFGVVGVLYDENFNRIYVKSNDNNVEGNIELTTDVNEAIVLDENKSKNLTLTLPDFYNPNYATGYRLNPVNEEVIREAKSLRDRVIANQTPSAFYPIKEIKDELPVAPKRLEETNSRLITLREFLDNNKATRLEIASETDRVLYAGNLFVRFANEQKAALNRTTLSDSWKQRVIALVNHDYTEGGLENTKNSLNALLEYKGGDISFGKKGTRITVWRKSKKMMIEGKPKIVRLDHAEEIELKDLQELLDYAKINVDKNFLQGVNVDFPIIKNGKLDYTNENFVEFYKDHHKTIARQVLVNGQYHFTPIKSLQFNIQSPEAKKLEELEVKLENPKIGDLEILPDTEISLMDVVNNLTSIANETTDSTRDILLLLNALLDNDEVKNKLSDGAVRFTTIKGKDFKGLVTNGKDIEINYALLSNMNLLGDVLAHEIVHVLTQRWLIANPNSKIKQDLDALLLLVPDSVPNYNKKDIYELLASISDPKIAAQLKTVQVEDKNLLEKLIDLFKELIGKIFGIESLEPNLYNEIVNKLVSISTSPIKAPEQPATKNKFGLKKRGDSTLPLGYSEEDLQQFYDNNSVSKSFLNLLVKSIDGDLAQHVHNKGKFQEFLAGKLDFTTTFREIFDSYVDAADAKETYTKEEETFFAALADGDFIEEYWIANTNFAKVRKPKKGEQDKTAKEPVVEIDTNDNEEVNEALPQEDEKPVGEDKETINQMVQDGGNEDKMGVERGTDKSSLELADPMTRAFIKMLPKVERVGGQTKVYTKEEYEQSNDKDKFVLVTQDKYIKFSYNELGRVELCDYTPTWNLIALNLKNLLSVEEMMDHIESDPKLIDVVPEIYIFKERLDQPINNEFRAMFKGAVETAFKKAGVSIFAIIHDTKTGNFLVRDESADFTMTAKQKINTQFINNVQSSRLTKYYNSVNSTFSVKAYLKDEGLINQAGEKDIPAIDKNDKFLKDLGFVLNVKTVFENGDENGFRRLEIQNFKQELVKFLSQFEEIEVRIADFITEDHGKIKGLNNWFKNVYEIENKNNPLVTTTMVKNAEGENQSVLSLYNGILQDRESYNKSKTEQELVEKIDRTRNDVFQYSITKKQLFRDNQRTDVKVLVDILSGLKVTEEGSATKGNLTIDLEDGEWLKLNFVGMLKNGIIENTRAETASTSYTFRLSDWSNKGKVQNTPFTIMDINEVWDVKEKRFNFGGQTSSEIYKAWSDYLKGELSRISKVGIRLNKDGSQAEQFGIYADILNKQDKEVLLGLLANSVSIDTIVADNTALITNALDRFFTSQFEEYSDLFENVMGGYASILGNLMDKSVNEDDKVGDVGIYNNVFNETNSGDYREAYKAFFVVNALTLHTEESILFQGDLTESPKYFKRAKGVQSTGTPLSISEDLQAWVNGFLQQYSFASIIGGTAVVGKTFDSATIEDDVKKSHYHTTGQLQKGYADSKKLYNEQIGKSQTDKDIQEEAEKLLADYAKNNIGDGDGKVTPDFYFALLALVGNITEEQILGFKALQLDARKNASKYNLGQDQQLTKEEELIMNEGLRLIGEGKVVFPKLKVTYRGNALTNHPVSKEIMDKFALFPLFPQFTYDKPAAHHLLKTMMKEGKAYTKFESGTKIQNLGRTKFLSEVEKGNFEVTLEDSQHTLLTEKLREQIKTPHKTKEKNTFGSQFRKLVISGLTALGKSFKLSTETIAGETVRQWEKLNQELSELTKEDVLKEFGISKVGDDWNYSQMNFPKVADLLLRESERKDLPDNIKVYFDKYKKGKLNQGDVDNYYKLFETSFGSQQIQSLIASIIKKISVQKLSGAQLIQVSQSIYDRQVKAEGRTRDLGFYHFKDQKQTPKQAGLIESSVVLSENYKNFEENVNDPNSQIIENLEVSDLLYKWYKIEDVNIDTLDLSKKTAGFSNNADDYLKDEISQGQKTPILINGRGEVVEGWHRIHSLKAIGAKTVRAYIPLSDTEVENLLNNRNKVQAAECKVSLIGDFKNLLNLQEVKDKLKGIENPNILEQTRALNELLEQDSFVEKYKDQLTIIGYRIPTQGFNSMEVMVIREFLPTFHGPTIVCPPEITTQSGTDYDYDKLSVIFPSISKDGRMSFKGSDYVQNGMIKVSAQILLDPINYHRLITPNTNAIIFDFLKGTKDVVGLLERLGISTKEYKNTEVLTMLVNLIKFKAVKGKGLLGIAAVWNTFTSLIQRHNWILNNSYTKSIGFGENKRDVDVNINPVLLKNKPEQINSSKPDTENGQSKQEIISQLINVTVDMPSDDTFGKSIFNKSDFGALTYGISMLGYDFETSMLFFHQPVVYQYKRLVQQKIQEGLKARVARFEAASELLGIDIPLDKKTGAPLWVEFEDRLFHQTSIMESKLDINDLNKDIKSLKEIPDVKIDNQQKAVLSHYLKLLDQASQIRTVQSAINFDTAPENSMYKVEERIKNRDEARSVNIINDSYLQEIERDSVVSGLNITSILSNVAKQLFPVLFNAETSNMFSNEAREYVGKEELAYRKVTNDFLLSILQNYGNYNGKNVFDVASSYIRGQNFLDFYKKGNEVKQILNKEGFNPRLLNILLLNSSKKKKNLNNPQLLLGFENTPEDKNKITEEWRTMLNSPNKEVKEFAETLAIIGIVQSGWAKSPIYFSDLIPEEFITPIISKAFDQYTQLDQRQQKEFRDKFIKLFKVAEGKSLGRKGRDYQIDSYRLIDYTIALEQPKEEVIEQTAQPQSDIFLDYVETLGKSALKATDQFKYFGAMYEIQLDENGKGINVTGYEGKNVNKQKLLDAYNTNPNVDPQNGKPFRTVEQPVAEQKPVEEVGKTVSVPEGSNPSNLPIFETEETIYLMNDQQQAGYDKIKSFVLERLKARDYEEGTQEFTEPLAKEYNNVIPKAMWNNMIGLIGKGGTGKTTTIRKIISDIYNDLIKQNKYNTLTVTYVAPTHNAVTILQESLGEDSEKVSKRVKTSASLVLRNQKKGSDKAVAGKPEDDLLLLDNKYYKEQLDKGFVKPILESDVLVIDESSMIDKSFIDDLLYRFSTEEEFVGRKMPIFIYMGDYRQLPPIRSDMDKSFREGIISATLFSDANTDKHAELTQVMRSKDQEFHRIFDSAGNQITNQRKEFNVGKQITAFDFKKYDEVTNKSSENILIAKENQVDHIIDMYVDVLINNENPYKMFWVHYNKLSNERTQQIFKKIRERYFEKLGKPKPSDEIQSGDYIEFVDSLPLQTLNNGEHKIVNGEIKPRARLKVLEYGHTDNIKLQSVSPSLSMHFGNLDLQGEYMIVYNRQNKKRYVQSIKDGSIGVGEYDKATKTQELFIIDNSGKKHVRKIPYGTYKNEIQPIINGLTRTINSLFKPSYIGSSHTVQGASIETVVVGDYNLRQNAPVINMRDMESSLYTMLTRAIKKLIIIKPNTIPIENNQEVFNLEDTKPTETTTTTDMSQLVNQPKTDKELINDYVTKVLTSQITPDWRKLGTPINTDRLRTNDSIPELVGLLKNKIKELETKLDEYEQDSEKFKDAIINVNSQIQGYGSLVFELENLKKQIPPLGYDEDSTNEFNSLYWKQQYLNKSLNNYYEFKDVDIPTIGNKFKPDENHFYHGTNVYKLDPEGNLILNPSKNFSEKTNSISLTSVPVVAQDYMLRKKGNYIIKINKSSIEKYDVESAEEIAINTNKPVIIPKGMFEIILVPSINEIVEKEYGQRINKYASELIRTSSSDLDLLIKRYNAESDAETYSELKEYNGDNYESPSWYVSEEHLKNEGARLAQEKISNIDRNWVVNAFAYWFMREEMNDRENYGGVRLRTNDESFDSFKYGIFRKPIINGVYGKDVFEEVLVDYLKINPDSNDQQLAKKGQQEMDEIIKDIQKLTFSLYDYETSAYKILDSTNTQPSQETKRCTNI